MPDGATSNLHGKFAQSDFHALQTVAHGLLCSAEGHAALTGWHIFTPKNLVLHLQHLQHKALWGCHCMGAVGYDFLHSTPTLLSVNHGWVSHILLPLCQIATEVPPKARTSSIFQDIKAARAEQWYHLFFNSCFQGVDKRMSVFRFRQCNCSCSFCCLASWVIQGDRVII